MLDEYNWYYNTMNITTFALYRFNLIGWHRCVFNDILSGKEDLLFIWFIQCA